MKINKRESILFYVVTAIVVTEVIIMIIMASKFADQKRFQKYISLGDKYFEEMDYENAELCYLEAIKINKKQIVPYINLSEVYMKMGKYDKARDIIKSARLLDDHMFSAILSAQNEKIDQEETKFLQKQTVNVNQGNDGDLIQVEGKKKDTPDQPPEFIPKPPVQTKKPLVTAPPTPTPTATPTPSPSPEPKDFSKEEVRKLVDQHYARKTGNSYLFLSEIRETDYGYFGILRDSKEDILAENPDATPNVLITGLEIHTDTGDVIDLEEWGENWSLYDELAILGGADEPNISTNTPEITPTVTLQAEPAMTYEKFLQDKLYGKNAYDTEPKEYVLFDLNKDGKDELLICSYDGDFQYWNLYELMDNEVVYQDSLETFGGIGYSEKYQALTFNETRSSIDESTTSFYSYDGKVLSLLFDVSKSILDDYVTYEYYGPSGAITEEEYMDLLSDEVALTTIPLP